MADELDTEVDVDQIISELETEEDPPSAVVEEDFYTPQQLEEAKNAAAAAAKAEVAAEWETKEAALKAQVDERLTQVEQREQERQKRQLQAIKEALSDEKPKATNADEDPEPEVDAWNTDSIKAHNRWAARQEVKALRAELSQQYGDLGAAQSSVVRPRAEETARAFLAKRGLEGLESTEEFQERFEAGYRNLSLANQANPDQVRQLASWAMGACPEEVLERVQKSAETKRAETAAQAARDAERAAMLGQTASANQLRTVTLGQPSYVNDEAAVDRQLNDALAGYDPEFKKSLKLMNTPLKDGRNGLEATAARNQVARNGRR